MAEKTITIWSNPKWRVLFDVTRLNRVKPWNVRLAEIVKALMEELQKLGLVDLQSCGVAAYSAATIHRMKSERLLRADIPRVLKERPSLLVPPPINLPMAPEFLTSTLTELIEALQKVLSKKRNGETVEQKPVLEAFDVKIDQFLLKLEERVEEFIKTLKEIFREKDEIEFTELVRNVDRLEAARRFILLLFAAARGVVELYQDDVRIRVKWVG